MNNIYSIYNYLSSPICWTLFTFGLILGSFLNVCIYRIPREIFWSSSRSFCFSCKSPIPAKFNIPILSYLFLRGRSRCCNTLIPQQYILVEFIAAVFIVFLYQFHSFIELDSGLIKINSHQLTLFGYELTFCYLMIVCSFIDLEFRIIPDTISLAMIALSPLAIWIHPVLSWQSSLLGILLGGGIIYAVAWTYYLIRKQEGIGMGDAKLLAAIGGWLGWESVFPTLLYSSVLGSIVGIVLGVVQKKSKMLQIELPFGPFLALAAIWHMLAPNSLRYPFF